MDVHADPLPVLRTRTSEKWTAFGPDVLPLFVAEMDYPLAPPVARAIIERVEASDTGYVHGPGPMPSAFAGFAERTWGWRLDEAGIRTTTDVSVAIVETLRRAVRPGDGVVIMPPVYPPFADLVAEAGAQRVDVPLVDRDGTPAVDLDGLERALAAGARAVLLCHPHNPVGVVHPPATLRRIAELAREHGATVVSDEIHGPLVHERGTFTPFLDVSDDAREVGVCVTAASKGWNVAGTKCALMVGQSERAVALLDGMPEEVGFRTSILGLNASIAAFRDGDEWLVGALAAIDANRRLLADLLAEHLPAVRYRVPDATYLAWLDFRDAGWGDDPAERALAAGVALVPGRAFGAEGRGHARLNLACSPDVLTEAVHRLTRA
ncbi:aminotransferase class I/II-fold pyridoxal phosphate-dependent enzyme [Actinotalea ferrariae]|uniref:MalY/PatB family protein n=1 Tax=Actinotalea ferrariae TaxID=1386098 RepID=UPI001C8BE665|nr:aminotransferase class I/II-fold pyridoxal phosphate-dependent enzyme [Actinotalea ferrariae]MBX9243791.1 aminotransferase class I/II-fold pyridoxal phosphate-dependent enzyme [Actinotalea ferrariae]